MLSISSRSASASDIRAYLEGERDGANRGPEDYYAESGQARGVWLGSGAAELHLGGRSHRASLRSLSRRASIPKTASLSCNVPASITALVGT